MWRVIDKEMSLKECSIYCYSPEDDPYDGEEGAIWSFNYFFFNKTKKRVCYIYLRGLSIISHSPIQRTPLSVKRDADSKIGDTGASKRARFWLGDRAIDEVSGPWNEDDEVEDEEAELLAEEEEEEDAALLTTDDDDHSFVFSTEKSISPRSDRSRSKSIVRGMSEDIVESMEI